MTSCIHVPSHPTQKIIRIPQRIRRKDGSDAIVRQVSTYIGR